MKRPAKGSIKYEQMIIQEDVHGENIVSSENDLQQASAKRLSKNKDFTQKLEEIEFDDVINPSILLAPIQERNEDTYDTKEIQKKDKEDSFHKMGRSEQAIIKSLIETIKERKEHTELNQNNLQLLSISELMEENRNIIQKLNQEEDEYEMLLLDKTLGSNSLVRQKSKTKSMVVQTNSRRFIFRYTDPYRVRWDMFVILLAFWNCFFIPYDIAFLTENIEGLHMLDQAINAIFLVDIIVNFRTTYYNKDGEEVFDLKKIAIQYVVGGRFIIDFLACIPWQDIIKLQSDFLKVFGILKLVRISRLSSIVSKLDLRDDIKAIIQVFQNLFYLIMYVHCTTCLWYYIISMDKLWVPPKDLGLGETDLYDQPITYQYFMCMYYSVLLVGGNELCPATTLQKFYGAIIQLVGNLINANIFGEMAVLMQVITRRSTEFQEKLDIANTIMHNIHITKDTQVEIREFYYSTRNTLEQQEEMNTFLDLISPSLKQNVSWHIFFEALSKNPLLKQLEQKSSTTSTAGNKITANGNMLQLADLQLRKVSTLRTSKKESEDHFSSHIGFVIQNLEIQLNRPEDEIVKQDDESNDMYFLTKGEAFVMIKERTGREHAIGRLEPGSHFGEIAMIYRTKRTATVISGIFSTFAKLSFDKYKEIIQYIPELQSVIKNHITNYHDPVKRQIIKMLRRIELFNEGIPMNLLTQLVYAMPSRQYDRGQLIFKPGDKMNTIQLIEEGVVEIYTYFEGSKFILERLFRGSIMNYRNLFLDDEPMQVYAECLRVSYILELQESDLIQVISQNEETQKKLLKYQNQLLKKDLVYPLDYVMIAPIDIMDKYYKPRNLTLETFKRFTRMKNVVMRRILEIRQMKAKPKLTDLLNKYRITDKDKNEDPNLTDEQRVQKMQEKRNYLKKKLLALYDDSGSNKKQLSEVEAIQKNLKTIKRKSDAQWQILKGLDKSINMLKTMRQEKDKKDYGSLFE